MPTPLHIGRPTNKRPVRAARSGNGGVTVFGLRVTDTPVQAVAGREVFVHLTREQATELADALVELLDLGPDDVPPPEPEMSSTAGECAAQLREALQTTDRGAVRADDPATTWWMRGWDEAVLTALFLADGWSPLQPCQHDDGDTS